MTNISSIPSALRGRVLSLINTTRTKYEASHKNRIRNLIKTMDHYKKNIAKYHKLAGEKGISNKREEYWRSKKRKYEKMLQEATNFLSRLKRGEFLDLGKVKTYISKKGDVVGETYLKKYKRSVEEKQQRQKENEIKSFIKKQISSGKTPDLKYIKQKFNISMKNALSIQKNIRSNLQKPKKRKELSYSEIKKFGSDFLSALTSSGLDINKSYSPEYLEKKEKSSFFKRIGKGSLTKFYELDPRDKKIIINYSIIKSVQKSLPSDKEMEDMSLENAKFESIITKHINSAKTIKEMRMLLNRIMKPSQGVTQKDRSLFNDLRSLNDKKIISILKGKNKADRMRLLDAVKSYNQLSIKIKQQKIKSIKSLELLRDKLLDRLSKSAVFGKYFKKGDVKRGKLRPLRTAILALRLIDIDNKIKNNKSINSKTWNEYNSAMDDLFGIKELIQKYRGQKKIIEKEKNLLKRRALMNLKILNFLSRSGRDVTDLLVKTAKQLWELMGIVYKKGKRGVGLLWSDVVDLLTPEIVILPERSKRKLMRRTRAIINKKLIKPISNFVTFIYRNPEIVVLATALMISSGVKTLRKIIVKNPEKALAYIVAFYLEGKIFGMAEKGVKLLKARFSPFVLRNIRVYEKDATLRGTAEALKKLEGKKINLFSASPNSVKELFKGITLGKKAEERLIRDMLKNPGRYIYSNFKIKSLKEIAITKPSSEILDFIKKTKDAIITGSSSLKLQLKKFRKIGDLDIISKNPRKLASELVEYLNSKTLWGKLWKRKRYSVKKGAMSGVWKIMDRKKAIADIDDFRLVDEDFLNRLGRHLNIKKDTRVIEGIKVLKVEPQLVKKLRISRDPVKAYRSEKELKDVKLILSKIKKDLKKKRYKEVKKLLDEEKGVLRVKADIGELGLDRKYGWAKKYLPDLNLRFRRDIKKEREIRKRLKRLGFTDTMIDKNMRLYAPDHFYFSPDMIYSYFLGKGGKVPKKATVIFVRRFKISKYPVDIQKLLRRHSVGGLNNREIGILRQKLNRWVKQHPDSVFVGEKALVDNFGEIETIAPLYTRLFPKKTFFKREIYIPSLERFIRVQEATIGKIPLPKLKKIVLRFKEKLKKGYSIKDMRKDLLQFMKKRRPKLREKSNKRTSKRIKELIQEIDNEIFAVKKLKIPESRKRELIRELRRKRLFLLPKRKLELKKIMITRIMRFLKRIKKRKKVLMLRSGLRIRESPKRRTGSRSGSRIRESPKRHIPPNIPLKISSWDSKLPRGYNFLVNGLIRVRGRNREIRLKTTPNRAMRHMIRLIDNSTARSFKLKIVGIRKLKDIKRPSLKKFRMKISKGSKVLPFVEKTKYAIDTKGEKRGLSISKILKKQKNIKRRRTLKKRR